MTESATPSLALVVSTIGRRPAQFRRLLESVHNAKDAERVELILVDQSADRACEVILGEQDWSMSVRSTRSERGLSLGRNTGLALASAPIVAFPDDDAWYPVDTLARVMIAFAEQSQLAVLCGRQVTADGRASMLRWQATAGPVTRRNFMHTSISSTMFVRRKLLARVGPFDEEMGVGSPTWYGACEESDLLLRIIAAGGQARYEPSLLVGQDEPRDAPDHDFVLKMLRYGCGQGHLWRKHRLPPSRLAYLCARKLVAATVRAGKGEWTLARADLAWLRGNVCGFIDRPPRALRAATVGA